MTETDQAISDEQWAELLQVRATDPAAISTAYAGRRQADSLLSAQGTMFLVAADHPARGALASGAERLAMADRRSLLNRLVTALQHPDVDGVLGSPDVIEELLLLGALDGKIVIGSMNRGGLDGATWTMDDRFTGYDAASIAACRLNGGKMLMRLDDQDPATASTLQSGAEAVSALAARNLMALIEPLPYRRETDGSLTLLRDTASLIRAITIASALGVTSAHTWLKLPSCENPAEVFAATTLPCVILGGVPGPSLEADLETWGAALSQPSVRGLVAGRSLLYPADGDVKAAVDAAASVLRASADRAGR